MIVPLFFVFFECVRMNKLRIGILDFYNLQNSERQAVVFNRSKGVMLSRSPKGYTLLSAAIKALGHIPVIYHPEHCQLLFENKHPVILYKGGRIKGCDVMMPRINVTTNVELELSVIKQFQLMGIPVMNKYLPISRAINKLRTLQVLTQAKIPVPKTIMVRRFEYLDDAIDLVGGYPVIIKSPFGTHGKGVAIIESRRSLYSALDMLWKYGNSMIILIQEYVAEAYGSDYRAFVVGDKVVAAMQRMAPSGDFRSNLYLGGNAVAVKLTDQEEKIAVRATKALGLDTSGVDILRTANGPLVLEMNASAGLAGIMKVTGLDVPLELVKYAVGLAKKT